MSPYNSVFFSSIYYRNPHFANGTCSSQLHHPQSTQTAEFLSQLAKHHPTMVAAAAASILWGNPVNGSVFEVERSQSSGDSQSHLPCCPTSSAPGADMQFHSHQLPPPQTTLSTAFQSIGSITEHHPSLALSTFSSTESERQDQAADRQRLHDDVVREGCEAASTLEETIRVSCFKLYC